jgi:diguanylate cyclase
MMDAFLRLLTGLVALALVASGDAALAQVQQPAGGSPEHSPPAAGYALLLAEADRIRSADARRFEELLGALEARRAAASRRQQQHLEYLQAYRSMLYGHDVAGGIERAKRLFDQAEDPDLQFRAGSLVVNGYAVNRSFTEGLRFLNQTLAMRQQVRDGDIRHDGINVAAVLYGELGQHALSLQYAEETLADDPRPRARCFAGHLRAQAQYFLGQLPHDGAALAAVVEECSSLGEHVSANFTRAVQARLLAARGEPKAAIRLLEDHVGAVEALGYPRLIAEFRSLLAELTQQQGNQAAAERHALATVAHQKSVASTSALALAFRTLYEIAEARGEMAEALDYHRRYAEADKAWLNEVKTRELAYQIVRQETSQKNQQIELLNRQNEVLQLQQEVQEQSAQNARLLVALLVVMLATIAFWAYKTKRVQMSLRRMAETDALTGICNRHHFSRQSERTLQQCRRAGGEAALVMFDLDHFKSINDRFGHAVGDWVLKRVVEACAPACRQVDTFGRLGGEEFAILLAGCDLEGARRVADECRERLAAVDTGDSGHRFRVTASFGVTTTAVSGYDLTRLLSHADRVMYAAKHGGRDRVSIYEPHAIAPLDGASLAVGEGARPSPSAQAPSQEHAAAVEAVEPRVRAVAS